VKAPPSAAFSSPSAEPFWYFSLPDKGYLSQIDGSITFQTPFNDFHSISQKNVKINIW